MLCTQTHTLRTVHGERTQSRKLLRNGGKADTSRCQDRRSRLSSRGGWWNGFRSGDSQNIQTLTAFTNSFLDTAIVCLVVFELLLKKNLDFHHVNLFSMFWTGLGPFSTLTVPVFLSSFESFCHANFGFRFLWRLAFSFFAYLCTELIFFYQSVYLVFAYVLCASAWILPPCAFTSCLSSTWILPFEYFTPACILAQEKSPFD